MSFAYWQPKQSTASALLDRAQKQVLCNQSLIHTHFCARLFALLSYSNNKGLFADVENDPSEAACCSVFLGFPFLTYIFQQLKFCHQRMLISGSSEGKQEAARDSQGRNTRHIIQPS